MILYSKNHIIKLMISYFSTPIALDRKTKTFYNDILMHIRPKKYEPFPIELGKKIRIERVNICR